MSHETFHTVGPRRILTALRAARTARFVDLCVAMQESDRSRFWEGFGLETCPSFRGMSVLEIGCGEGQRAFEITSRGAQRVVGLDPMASSIAAARQRQASNPWKTQVSFFQGTIDTLPAETFDIILSENTLEHVLDVPSLLAAIRNRLRAEGKCYLGFGPLYHAPDGDHGWIRAVLPGRRFFLWPWGHLIFERYAFNRLSEIHGRAVRQTRDWPYLSLNQHTGADYKRMFEECGMRIKFLRTNYVSSLKGHLVAVAGRLPMLSKYCTLNMFVVLEKA